MKQRCPDCGQMVKPQMVNGTPTCPRCGADMDEDSMNKSFKAGARHSAADRSRIQALHDHAVALGATCNEPDADDMPGKSISKRPDVNPKEGTNEYGDVAFADEKNKKYPIDTEEHIRSAWNYINHADNASKYDPEEVATIKRKIVAAWKDKIDKEGPPSADEKSWDFSYIQRLHLPKDEQFFKDVLAVKSIGADDIQGYIALWGDPHNTDMEGEYFTKATDFWDDKIALPRPLTWEHGQDRDFKSRVVIGAIKEFEDDDIGRIYRATLDRHTRYREMVDKVIERKAIGTSSDSASQYVVREQKGGATWLKQWPLWAGSLTATPCEPRMFDTVHFKSLGVQLPDPASAQATALAAREIPADIRRKAALLKLWTEV